MKLASVFSDHMVVQRDCALPVWGVAAAGEKVTVSLAGQTAAATAGVDGRWRVNLQPIAAGGPFTLVAKGANSVTINDILAGEVWVCSGQSNMEWPLEMTTGKDEVIAEADQPAIRLLTVPKRIEVAPAAAIVAEWEVCTPDNVAGFSGVAYHFGRELRRRLQVPIGLVNTSWGGTPAQAWTSLAGLKSEPALAGYVEALQSVVVLTPEEARRKDAAARAEFLAKLPQDQGNRGFAEGWAGREFDDRGWKTMKLPEYWINAGHPTNGVFWFRKTIEVPAAWAGQAVQLSLSAVDKSDDTYVNGTRVGGINWVDDPQSWATRRNYTVPAGVLTAGKNVIAVRVLSNFTGGGIVGSGAALRLEPPAGNADAAVPLAGEWRYCIEQDFGRVTGIEQPAMANDAHTPSMLFNGMIAPLLPMAIRGAIWYQGESNAADAARYATLFPTMIRDWRQHWGQGAFPFYFVQLANFRSQPATAEADNSRWAELREAQTAALKLPHTGMAVAIEIGEPADIHPRNKKDVGLRLALNALAQDYGQAVKYRGPRFKALTVQGSAARVEFAEAAGLTSKGGVVQGFAVAGADQVFYVATAKIEGTAVVVTSDKVAKPVAVRYGWADCPVCTLYNAAGLPAEPFRTDGWAVGAGAPKG